MEINFVNYTIDLLKNFLEDCNSERSVAKALKYYRNCYGKTKVKRLITMLDDIDTNYVTVTNADVKLFDSGYIPTPYELYKEFMQRKLLEIKRFSCF